MAVCWSCQLLKRRAKGGLLVMPIVKEESKRQFVGHANC